MERKASLFILLLTLLFHITSSLPTATPPSLTDTIGASSHNMYLVTCTSRSRRRTETYAAIAFFLTPVNSSPVNSSPGGRGRDRNLDPRPDNAAIISERPNWENKDRRIKVWGDTIFTPNITAGAGSLTKGALAGAARLEGVEKEEFVCFRDGETELGMGGSNNGDDDAEAEGELERRQSGRNGDKPRNRGRDGDDRWWKDHGWGRGRGRAECVADYWCGSLA